MCVVKKAVIYVDINQSVTYVCAKEDCYFCV